MSQDDQEVLGSLIYLSGAVPGQGDDNTTVSKFIASLNNTVYSQYMQGGSLDDLNI